MATGLSAAEANALLTAYTKGTDYSGNTEFWVQLHTADPGASGTTAAATESDRKQCTFGTASGGAITTTAALEWLDVAATETYTHVSFWTASTSGTFLGSDGLATSVAVTAGDDFTIAAGDVDLSLGAVAA